MTTPRTVRLLEFVASGPGLEIDEDAGCLRNVRVLGLESANGRRYLAEGVAAAAHLYEHRPVYWNHKANPKTQRLAEDKGGWLENVRPAPDGGLVGDLHYLKSHPMTPRLLEAAARRPDFFGLSHDALGREQKGSRGRVIEGVDRVNSIDLVADPASVRGLHESKGNTVKITWKQLLEHVAAKPVAVTALREMMGAANCSPDDDMRHVLEDMDGADMGAVSHEDALKAGFSQAIHAIVDDESMDMASKLSRMKQVMQAQEKLLGGEETPADATSADVGTEESRKQEKADPTATALREELAVRDLIEDAGLRFTKPAARKAFAKSLVPLTEGERKALIEERKGQGASKAPRSQGPGSTTVQEGREPTAPPRDGKDAARRWRS
jgi:hypothetical protein